MIPRGFLWAFLLLSHFVSILSSPLSTTPASPTTSINIDAEVDDVEHHTLSPGAPAIEVEALNFVKGVNKKSFKAYNDFAVASWNYETNITDESEAAKVNYQQ